MTTGLLLTRNRLDFLRRALKFYDGRCTQPIIILDASDPGPFAEITAMVRGLTLGYPVELLHHDVTAPWSQRLVDGLARVATPYAMLMADDDFYYPTWIVEAADYLSHHLTCSTVYGHAITFELEGGFPSHGPIRRVENNRPNPPLRWMGHESSIDRLHELRKGAWGGNWYYSLQRTQVLEKMITQAHAAGFPQDMFERTQSILQPIYGQVVMLDSIYAARQVNPLQPHRGFSFRTNQAAMAALEGMAIKALVESGAADESQARDAVQAALKPEIAKLKSTDFREAASLEKWKAKLPLVTRTVQTLKSTRNRVLQVDPLARDSRFPVEPDLTVPRAEISMLEAACRTPAENQARR